MFCVRGVNESTVDPIHASHADFFLAVLSKFFVNLYNASISTRKSSVNELQ